MATGGTSTRASVPSPPLPSAGHQRRGFTDVAHIRYYDAAPQTALEAAARDLIELLAMGFVAGHAGKEKILSRPKSLYGCGCPLW